MVTSRVAGVGWLSCTTAESLRAFIERVFANFCKKNIVLQLRENRQFVVVKGVKHTHTRSLKHSFRCLDMYFFFTKLLFYKSSRRALQKQALRKLSESSPKALRKLSESSTKAGSTKALRKPSKSFPKALQKLSESSLKAL